MATMPKLEPRFELGQVVATPGVLGLELDWATLQDLLLRHATGDRGELDEHDKKKMNEYGVSHGPRIFSVYNVELADKSTRRIWLITEADPSVTTFLLPEEY